MVRDEEPLGHLTIREPLRDQPGDGQLGVGHGCPAPCGSLGSNQAAAYSQCPQAAPQAASIPGRSGLGVQLQSPTKYLDAFCCIATVNGGDTQVLERAGESQWTGTTLV